MCRAEIEGAYAAQLAELATTVVPPEQLGYVSARRVQAVATDTRVRRALADVWTEISKETSVLADAHQSLSVRLSSLPPTLQQFSKTSSEWAKVKEYQAELLKLAGELDELEAKDVRRLTRPRSSRTQRARTASLGIDRLEEDGDARSEGVGAAQAAQEADGQV